MKERISHFLATVQLRIPLFPILPTQPGHNHANLQLFRCPTCPEGLLTTLPSLGIVLDTIKMEARLSEEKLKGGCHPVSCLVFRDYSKMANVNLWDSLWWEKASDLA